VVDERLRRRARGDRQRGGLVEADRSGIGAMRSGRDAHDLGERAVALERDSDPNTRMPTKYPSAPPPVPTISPAKSSPHPRGGDSTIGRKRMCPARILPSTGLSDAARTRTTSSPARGVGSSVVTTSSTSGGP
jgi:hypothetical protein